MMNKTILCLGLAGVLAGGVGLIAYRALSDRSGEEVKPDPTSKGKGGLDAEVAHKLAEGNNALAFELFERVTRAGSKGNLAFSPHSLMEVMSLADAGAKGDTAKELKDGLHLPLPPDQLLQALGTLDRSLASGGTGQTRFRIGLRVKDGKDGVEIVEVIKDSPADKAGLEKGKRIVAVDGIPVRTAAEYHALLAERPGPVYVIETPFRSNSTEPYRVSVPRPADSGFRLDVANALWARKGLKFRPEFLASARKLGAAVETVDFSAPKEVREIINGWVARKTEGHIAELLPTGSLKADTGMVLTNAVYFQAAWASAFHEDATRSQKFNGVESDFPVRMMSQTGNFRLYKTETHQFLEMPFRGTSVVMDLILPDKGTPLSEFEKSLTAANLAKWVAALRRERKVLVKVPRFDISATLNLKNILNEMGLKTAFGPRADFSGIAEGKDLMIGLVTHRAAVKMREDGVTAAAATGATFVPKSIEMEDVKFIADRPFLFVIRDKETNIVLFLGRVTEPEKSTP